MEAERLVNAAELVAGTVVLVAGLATAAVAAYTRSFIGVFAGSILFLAGYKLSQVSATGTSYRGMEEVVSDILKVSRLVDLLMALVGTGTIAYGFTVLLRSVNRASVPVAFAGSGLLLLGYVIAHYAVNNTLV